MTSKKTSVKNAVGNLVRLEGSLHDTSAESRENIKLLNVYWNRRSSSSPSLFNFSQYDYYDLNKAVTNEKRGKLMVGY